MGVLGSLSLFKLSDLTDRELFGITPRQCLSGEARGETSSINLRDGVSGQCIRHKHTREEEEGCPVIDY